MPTHGGSKRRNAVKHTFADGHDHEVFGEGVPIYEAANF